MGAVDDDSAAVADEVAAEVADSAFVSEESAGPVSLDLSRLYEADDDESHRDDSTTVPNEDPPRTELTVDADAGVEPDLQVELAPSLGDEFFLSPEPLEAIAAGLVAPTGAHADAGASASESFAGTMDTETAGAPVAEESLVYDATSWDPSLAGLEGFGEGTMMSMMGQATVTVVATGADVLEGINDSQKYKFTRTGGMMSMSLTVNYTMTLGGGTATPVADYSSPSASGTVMFQPNEGTAYVALTAARDNLVEATETAIITITAGTMYAVGTPSSATAHIVDDPARVSVSAPDPLSAEQDQETGKFRFSRTGGNVAAALQVRFTLDGSTAAPGEYSALPLPTLAGEPNVFEVTIPATQSSVEVTITPGDDTTVEGEEFIRYTVVPHPSNTYVVAAPSAMVLIEDNDALVVVDLDIHDGQYRDQVLDSDEFTRGAYTVANLNDTDGDGRIDNVDQIVERVTAQQVDAGDEGTHRITVADLNGIQSGDDIVIVGQDENNQEIVNRRHVLAVNTAENDIFVSEPFSYDFENATVMHAGRDELDLMKLVVRRPNPDLEGSVTLMTEGAIVLWENWWKETQVTTTTFLVSTIPAGGLELWVEPVAASNYLRDIVIQLEYQGVKDIVTATGIWSTVTAVAHERRSVLDLVVDPEWSDIDDPVRASLLDFEYVGLNPSAPFPIGVRNVIAIQFTIAPYRDPLLHGTWEDDDVHFDVGRQININAWTKDAAEDDYEVYAVPPMDKKFPIEVERANDDGSDDDESAEVTERGGFYAMDAPGRTSDTTLGLHEYVAQFDANEWLRVGFTGERLSGDSIAGSRTSETFRWHVGHWLIDDGTGKWRRTTGDAPESPFVNDVGPLHGGWTDPE